MTDTKRQADLVLQYLKKHPFITAWAAMQELRVLRLAAVIKEMKNAGYVFHTEYNRERGDDGIVRPYAKYYLVEEPNDDLPNR